MIEPVFDRVLLKLSGEVLANEYGFGIDPEKVSYLAEQIKPIYDANVDIGLIIGAGNIFRGMEAAAGGMDRVTGDYLGMLATIMNAIALQDSLEKIDCETRTLSAINVTQIAEPYIRRRAIRHLEKGRVVIFVAGTGNPYFTTDTAATLRAIEINADVIAKGTRVDGVYTSDPESDKSAKKIDTISIDEVYKKNLSVMDMTAFTLCKENKVPIIVFDINDLENLTKLAKGEKIGTFIEPS